MKVVGAAERGNGLEIELPEAVPEGDVGRGHG